jgi:fused signal recognition particle receptor
VSKKKGMLSWLGLGKQEEQINNAAHVIDEENDSREAIEPIETSSEVSEVTLSDLAEAKTTAEINTTLKASTQDTFHLQSEVDVTSNEGDNVSQAAKEVSDNKKQTDPISEKSANSESNEIGKKEVKLGFFARLKLGLSKTSENLSGGLVDLFRGKQIDDELFEELETHLLLADVGVETTMKIIDSLTQSASRKELKDASALHDLLKVELQKVIEPVNKPLVIKQTDEQGPFVILMVGVNGVGKTTTIGKLAKQFQAQGKSVMLAAGDTFRAAAVEQLQVWGERNDIPVIAQHTGADSASVIFDAISAAKARQVDVIIADTAGRLQNKAHLMEELKKVVRVMKKLDVKAPHEVMLTLDAGTGQNALSQTKLFDEAVGLTGLTITKLDGTAKGGVIFAIADKYNIPIRYLGVGEGIDDLRPFNGNDFIEALFNH